MSSKKTKPGRKDPTKTPKVWERARREKMKIYFNELQEVLPFYDPSNPMSRFEILQKSKTYIKELQDQNQDLLNGGFDEVYKSKMTKLKQRVKELLRRVEQLTDLLKAANIMIPPIECYQDNLLNNGSIKWIHQQPKKWTEKINLVVPDDKIKSILTMIKDYKKTSGKFASKKKVSKNSDKGQNNVNNNDDSGASDKKGLDDPLKKKDEEVTSSKDDKIDQTYEKIDLFSGSQSPSQFKENQPVDFNLLSVSETIVSKSNNGANSSTTISSNNNNSGDSNSNGNTSNSSKNNDSNTTAKDAKEESDCNSNVGNSKSNKNDNSKSNGGNNDRNNNSSKSNNKNQSGLMPADTSKQVSTANLTVTTTSKPRNSQKQLDETRNIVLPSASTNLLQSNTFILTNNGNLLQLPVLNSSGALFSTNSNLLTSATIVKPSTGLITPIVINKPSPVIVLQESVPQIIQAAQILNAAPQVISVSKSNVQILNGSAFYTTPGNNKPLAHITAKPPPNKKRINAQDSTVTTYVNKIPIPALSKQSYTKKTVPGDKGKPVGKGKEVEKPGQNESDGETAEPESAATSSSVAAEQGSPEDKGHPEEAHNKRGREPADDGGGKKQKLDEALDSSAVFRPIENPMEADASMFCNLGLPNTMNPSLSVSPTAAFLSTFPIVAPTRPETDECLGEKKAEDGKEGKQNQSSSVKTSGSHGDKGASSKEFNLVPVKEKGDLNATSTDNGAIISNGRSFGNGIAVGGTDIDTGGKTTALQMQVHQQDPVGSLDTAKSWMLYHQDNCDIRTDPFFLPSDNSILNSAAGGHIDATTPADITFPGLTTGSPYKSYVQNGPTKTNGVGVQANLNDPKIVQFDYQQKDSYQGYGGKKPCAGPADGYKTQTGGYNPDAGLQYQMVPAAPQKEATRNARTVNWMTEPDVRGRHYAGDKMSKVPGYPETFYANNRGKMPGSECGGGQFAETQAKSYPKGDFYGKEHQGRCKTMEKRNGDGKCYGKPAQNYNLFEYGYGAGCFGEDEASKFCNVQQSYGSKGSKKPAKKKGEGVMGTGEQQAIEPVKRPPEVAPPMDFNPVSNQECFTWMPGKNVDWLPGKSFGLDSNMVVPSTLPTLVGDLALGTTPTNDSSLGKPPANPKPCQSGSKTLGNDIDLSMAKDGLDSTAKHQYQLEPFVNLSKNIFDVTPSQGSQMGKNEFAGNGGNETIVLKNIFELPAPKATNPDYFRAKERPLNQSQNSFLSVSQLVETPHFDGQGLKGNVTNNGLEAKTTEMYGQGYFGGQKPCKGKSRGSQCKFRGYKNGSSYTAEALIRSNEFAGDINPNYYPGKSSQKGEQFVPEGGKTDFQTPNQNIYTDFNFSSPVSNFAIGSTVASTDFSGHDAANANYSGGNNSFFADFIPPEYPLSDANSLLLPPCSISLQSPFGIDKRANFASDKSKANPAKQFAATPATPPGRHKKHYDCTTKTGFNDFAIPSSSSSGSILPTSSLSHPILTTSTCQNLLPVPTQSIPITFPSPSFATANISFPAPLPNGGGAGGGGAQNPGAPTGNGSQGNRFTNPSHNSKPQSHNCYPFPATSQSAIPFFSSLSNPIVPSPAPAPPSTSGNSLANFNLSTIFPEINQKGGSYHYS